MTPAEALDAIRGHAAANRIETKVHARQRMRERNVSHADLRHALMTAARCRLQPANQRWRVDGADLDGDELTVIVVIDGGAVVVTLF